MTIYDYVGREREERERETYTSKISTCSHESPGFARLRWAKTVLLFLSEQQMKLEKSSMSMVVPGIQTKMPWRCLGFVELLWLVMCMFNVVKNGIHFLSCRNKFTNNYISIRNPKSGRIRDNIPDRPARRTCWINHPEDFDRAGPARISLVWQPYFI